MACRMFGPLTNAMIRIFRVKLRNRVSYVRLTHLSQNKTAHFLYKLLMYQNICILIEMSLKVVAKGQINNNAVLDDKYEWPFRFAFSLFFFLIFADRGNQNKGYDDIEIGVIFLGEFCEITYNH